jgi:hypothetical protein
VTAGIHPHYTLYPEYRVQFMLMLFPPLASNLINQQRPYFHAAATYSLMLIFDARTVR